MTNGYILSVGEPWDFAGPAGQNVIWGNIVRLQSNTCLIFKSAHSLRFAHLTGEVLVLTPRHRGNDFADLATDLVVVNGHLLTGAYAENVAEHQWGNRSAFVLVGSIRKAGWRTRWRGFGRMLRFLRPWGCGFK